MCGILGYSGKSCNIDKIKILFLFNEARGRHASGIWSEKNGMFKKAITASSFIQEKQLMDFDKSNLVLAHTRLGTMGANIDENAHPFEKNDDKNIVVGIHNGVIHNHQEITKKLNTSINVDSEAIFDLMLKESIDSISELNGSFSIAFIKEEIEKMQDLKPISLHCFKHTNPFFIGYCDDGMYFSSLLEGLHAIGCNEVFTLKEDHYYEIVDGKILSIKEIKIKTPQQPLLFQGYYNYRHNNSYYSNYKNIKLGDEEDIEYIVNPRLKKQQKSNPKTKIFDFDQMKFTEEISIEEEGYLVEAINFEQIF